MHLVTGGSGYFGEILVKLLLSKGLKVRVFDLNSPSEEIRNKVEFLQGDIRARDNVESALDGVEYVHHNVAQVPLAKNKNLFFSVNYKGTKNLLDLSLEKKIKKIVYTSSSAIFGIPDANPVNENTIPSPFETYGIGKYEAEILCKSYVDLGLDISIVRPRTILGHGRMGIFSILFEWIKEGYNIPVLNNGQNIYQFIHAEDLANICWLVSQTPKPALYNAGAFNYCTMRETLEGFIPACGNGK